MQPCNSARIESVGGTAHRLSTHKPDGGGGSGDDDVIKDHQAQARREVIAHDERPVVALVDGLVHREGAAVEVRLTVLADAEVRQSAGVLGVLDHAALGGEDVGDAGGKWLMAGSVETGAIFHETGGVVAWVIRASAYKSSAEDDLSAVVIIPSGLTALLCQAQFGGLLFKQIHAQMAD